MTNDEKILEILMQMQSDISDLKTGQAKLEQDVTDLKTGQAKLEQDVAGLKTNVADLKTDVAGLKTDVADLKTGQEGLSHNVINLENELVPKVTALFDGYTLRGEQINNLKAHIDERFDDFQEDVTYLISKTAKQEKQIFSVSKQVKQILPQ